MEAVRGWVWIFSGIAQLEGVAEKPEEVFSVIYLFPLSHVHYNFFI